MAGEYIFWHLHGTINSPTLRADGSILEQPGYDVATGLYFDPCGTIFPAIPQNPTLQNAKQAAALLLDVISEFPFKSDADRAVAFAYILTALVRRILPTAPGCAISAPSMGTGKTRLANLASHIANGCPADNISYTADEAEMSKRIFSLLAEGAGVVVLDNLEQPLAGETLCVVMTQPLYKGRTLGKSEMQSVSTCMTLAATGNNLTMRGDITARFLLCEMDAQVERPEERAFRRNLDEYIPARRADLVVAGLTLLRAHFLATNKPKITPYGRFEEWSDFVRSAVVWIGQPDPLGTREGIDVNDPVRESLLAVLTAWDAVYRETPHTASEVINDNKKELLEALEAALSGRGEINAKRLGRWIRRHQGRIVAGKRFVCTTQDAKRGSEWIVQDVQNGVFGDSGVISHTPCNFSNAKNIDRAENNLENPENPKHGNGQFIQDFVDDEKPWFAQ
jgi:hypothetical protein